MIKKTIIPEILLILTGLFLFVDGIFMHLISYDYSAIGISFLDPIINHWWIGIILIVIGVLGVWWRR